MGRWQRASREGFLEGEVSKRRPEMQGPGTVNRQRNSMDKSQEARENLEGLFREVAEG